MDFQLTIIQPTNDVEADNAPAFVSGVTGQSTGVPNFDFQNHHFEIKLCSVSFAEQDVFVFNQSDLGK
jgi:hypothetical protein